jgi:hypothetical protein
LTLITNQGDIWAVFLLDDLDSSIFEEGNSVRLIGSIRNRE